MNTGIYALKQPHTSLHFALQKIALQQLYCNNCTVYLQHKQTKNQIKCRSAPSSLGCAILSFFRPCFGFCERTFLGQKCFCTMIAFLARSCTSGWAHALLCSCDSSSSYQTTLMGCLLLNIPQDGQQMGFII